MNISESTSKMKFWLIYISTYNMRPKKSSDNEADNYALFSVIIRPTLP